MDESANKGMKLKVMKKKGMKLKGCDAAIPKACDSGRMKLKVIKQKKRGMKLKKARDTGMVKLKVIKKERGMKLEGCDAAIPKPCDIGRISVTGFDSGLPHEDVECALREHFASCGKITDVYIAKLYNNGGGIAYIYLVGEGAVDKALKLNGSDVGGWKVCAEAYPFRDDKKILATVEGYDTSLSDTLIEIAVRELLSSCGEITDVTIIERFAAVHIKGIDAADNARELNGSYIGGRQVLVGVLTGPPRYTVHNRRRYRGRDPLPDMMAKNMMTAE